MAKNQFIRPLGITKKQPSLGQPGAAAPQGEQIRSAPARQGLADPSLQSSSDTPYSPTEQPYLQAPQGLPGIPTLPAMPKKGQLTNTPPPETYPGPSRGWAPNEPKQVRKWVPSGLPSSTNPAGKVPGSTNGPSNKGIFSPASSSSQGNLPRPVTLRPGTGNLSLGNTPNPPSSSNSQYLGGVGLTNASNLPFSGRPAASYSGESSLGMARVSNASQGIQAPFQRADPSAPSGPKPPKKQKYLPIWARIAIGLLVFLIIVTGVGFGYYEIKIAPSLNNILGKQATHRSDSQVPGANNQGTPPTGRTNILLLGSDTDGKGNDPINGTPLAQTVMIITVDPQTNYVGMLSIPRDMQVTENGYSAETKLDEVFSNGYNNGNTLQDKVAAGAGEMEDVIQYNYGIHIDHYAWVGLNGFVKVIDTAGGVDIDTIHPMVDDTYPDDVGNTTGSIYDSKRLYIAPGPQHLNGLQALEYVRTRHSDLIGDFGRTIRQQQIINQLKTKLATPDTIGKASELLQDLNGAVQTDMQLSDVIGLGNLARGIDSNSVQRLTLGPPDYAVPSDGGRATNYLPVCSNIIRAIRKMFNIASPNCVSQFASNSSIASTPSSTTPTAFNTMIASEPKQGSTSNDAFKGNVATNIGTLYAGVHGLLDVLYATTFESFEAMQV